MLKDDFLAIYGETDQPVQLVHCPARVNLIGEHIDYNGGLVMPAAISIGISLAIRERKDNKMKFAAWDSKNPEEIALSASLKAEKSWTDYPVGIVSTLEKAGYKVSKGFDSYFVSTIPPASGLSSSAALEVAYIYGICMLNDITLSLKDMALLSQKAENEFVGVNCGIMDQYAVALGKKDMCLLLDCGKVEHEYIPAKLGNYSLIVSNTNKKRGLSDSAYNQRRKETQEVFDIIKEYRDIEFLCDLTMKDFKELEDKVRDPILKNRFRHSVSENDRVKLAADFLKQGKIEDLGRLLNESHDSLKNDFEVSGFEQDTLNLFANKFPACIGSRMTGAGFGGCHISLVKKGQEAEFEDFLQTNYTKETGLKADFYKISLTDGVHHLS